MTSQKGSIITKKKKKKLKAESGGHALHVMFSWKRVIMLVAYEREFQMRI